MKKICPQIIHKNKIKFNEEEYSLQSIVYHDGNSNSGHYFCHVNVSAIWYQFNDGIVNKNLIIKN